MRTAGIVQAIAALGHLVQDLGDVTCVAPPPVLEALNPAVHHLREVAGWIAAATDAAVETGDADLAICLGGDHALAAGTVAGRARVAAARGRPQFVLWLDAHADFHTLDTTASGNLHGTPLAYACGLAGFAGHFPPLTTPVDPAHVCMLGLRSVDPAERDNIAATSASACYMRSIERHGPAAALAPFLERVAAADGELHVSFDLDFLDPEIAPGVGTPVPGGATFLEARRIMDILGDSGLVRSLDIAELNPLLDPHGRTAALAVDLVASLMGRRIVQKRSTGRA